MQQHLAVRAGVEREPPPERSAHVQPRHRLGARGDLELAVVGHAEDRGLPERLHEAHQLWLREATQIRRARVRQRPQLRTETKARVGVANDEAMCVEGEEDVAQGALGDLERSRELRDALGPSALGERAQDPRGLLYRRDRTQGPRTVRHTRTEHSTPAETLLTLAAKGPGSRLAHASRPGGT